jgi:galactokinase
MWTVPNTLPAPDRVLLKTALHDNADLFDPRKPLFAARAPGRLDVIGGIADYSGSLVLELPLAVATIAIVQPTEHPTLTIRSTSPDSIFGEAMLSLPLDALQPNGHLLSYDEAHALLGNSDKTQWAAYVIGPLFVLMRERGLQLKGGLRILVCSAVPAGKGVSSSAAIEVATLQALCGATGIKLNGRDLALLSQLAENRVVGAPCGVMDQMTSACGVKNSLLALECQPAEIQAPVKLPAQLAVWGIDSGIRHAVSGADYGSVRIGAFMGYRIIADILGLTALTDGDGRVIINDARTKGYLANIAPSEWEQVLRDKVPLQLKGADFLAKYHGITDTVTRVQPDTTYAVRQPTAHPIYEHQRVRLFRALLQRTPTPETKQLLGELMYQAHNSYSACGLGSDGTDLIVNLARSWGADKGIYGAKITGGGSGGTVAILSDAKTGAAATQAIASEYMRLTQRTATILSGSSDGAAQTGVLKLAALKHAPQRLTPRR